MTPEEEADAWHCDRCQRLAQPDPQLEEGETVLCRECRAQDNGRVAELEAMLKRVRGAVPAEGDIEAHMQALYEAERDGCGCATPELKAIEEYLDSLLKTIKALEDGDL